MQSLISRMVDTQQDTPIDESGFVVIIACVVVVVLGGALFGLNIKRGKVSQLPTYG